MMNNGNNNTMNNNNNNNDNTMSNSYDNSSRGLPIAEAVLSTPAQQQQQQQQHQPETSSALYKLAARNLREYHGVPSMTALKLEKTVARLGLRPRRLVAQGLAPRKLLKDSSSPLVLAGESSGAGQEELCEAVTGTLMDASGDDAIHHYSYNNSSEDMLHSDDSNSTYDVNDDSIDNLDNTIVFTDNGDDDTEDDVEGFQADKKKRPIHAALVAGGIDLQPRETRPLLHALGVSPHRLVKLGLVKREAIRAMAGRRGGGAGPGQHLRGGGPGKRGVGGGPRGPPQGPPRLPFHGADRHAMHRGEESDERGMSAPLGPHGGPGHRGPRHHGGRPQGPPHGPGHHSMLTVGHGCGPPGGGKHGHGRRHPPHGFRPGHGHHAGDFRSEGGGEGGERLHGRGAGGPRQHGPRRDGGGMGRPRGPPHGPPHAHGGPSSGGGQSGLMHGPPRRPMHGAGQHGMHPGEESEEEGMSAALGPHGGPGHRGPRQHGGGKGRSCGGPQGPVHGPPRGPLHRLFHEGAAGAPPGMMAHRRGDSPSRGGGGMKQRGGRHGGGTGFGGGGGGGGGDMQHRRRAYLAHFHGGRHQPQLEAYSG